MNANFWQTQPGITSASFNGSEEPDFDGTYYSSWRAARLGYLRRVLGARFFEGKSVLELGAGFGHIGRALSDMGASVTCVDGRETHVKETLRRGGVVAAHVADLDRDFSGLGSFDVIVNFGILYHLTDPFAHLAVCEKVLAPGGTMLLESMVADSADPEYRFHMEERGYDQSLSGRAVYLPPVAIETRLRALGFHVLDISSPAINEHYDWRITGRGGIARGPFLHNRRMWLVSRDPQLIESKGRFRARTSTRAERLIKRIVRRVRRAFPAA